MGQKAKRAFRLKVCFLEGFLRADHEFRGDRGRFCETGVGLTLVRITDYYHAGCALPFTP